MDAPEPSDRPFDEAPEHSRQVSTDAAEVLLARLRAEPQRLARYEVHEVVGRGGMGTVFRATDRDIQRRVAMKVLDDHARDAGDPGAAEDRRRRFLSEAQVTGQLDHPGIVSVHDLGLDEKGRVFFTMKFVRGRTLTEVLPLVAARQEGWTLTRVLGVVLKVCEALAFAHSRGVIHRDLKPDNIMVGRFGETYVMDWGLSRLLHEPVTDDVRPQAASSSMHTVRDRADGDTTSPLITADGAVVGTPSFMAPEQAEGRIAELSARTDVYAVGAVLYQVLTGEIPYARHGATHSPRTILARVIDGPPTPVLTLNPAAAPDLVAVCEKAMSRQPQARYETTMELAADIEAFLDRRPVRARGGLLHAVWLGVVRHKAIAATSALAFAAIVAVGAWSLHRVTESRRLTQRVADLMIAQALVEEAETSLTPRVANTAGRTATWMERTEALLERAPSYGEDAMRGEDPSPLSPAEFATLQRLMEDLVKRRETVQRDLRFAETLVAAPTGPILARWQEVFADLAADERWRGLEPVPQPGLVPLRKNPAGFWQFLLLGTGDEPLVDPGTGQIVVESRMGAVLVLLPGGTLELGFADGESNEKPHEVTLRPFLLGAYEVTQGQWMRVMVANPSNRRSGTDFNGISYDDWNPVETISWYEASRFAALAWARLPGEDELECAGRGGSPQECWFDGRRAEALELMENLADAMAPAVISARDRLPWNDGFPDHAPVGSFRSNGIGLFDVGGNVSEWTADYYTADRGLRADAAASHPDRYRRRVVRGSNWGEPRNCLRASYRKYQRPDYVTMWLGARLARTWMSRADVDAAAASAAVSRRSP